MAKSTLVAIAFYLWRILLAIILVYIRFTAWLLIFCGVFYIIRPITYVVICGPRWLMQASQYYFPASDRWFPAFDRWTETRYNSIAQQFKEERDAAILMTVALFLTPPHLLTEGYRYVLWIKPYFRDRHEAANPETNPERLRKFSDGVNPNPFLCRVIARNPNTPTDVLLKLGEKFPKQLFANPIFNLLLLENPNLLKTMHRDTLKSLLQLKEIPIGFLEQAASYRSRDEELMKVIAKHPKTPKYLLEKIAHRR